MELQLKLIVYCILYLYSKVFLNHPDCSSTVQFQRDLMKFLIPGLILNTFCTILLSPTSRAGDYKMHSVRVCVCSCVIECVSRFYKGLYITLVVSPWPFQCFL